jgi:hypothetical protein
MRKKFPPDVENGRIITGKFASKYGEREGAFSFLLGSVNLTVIMSSGDDWAECGFPPPAWEHVSVSLRHRCPTWDEMVYVAHLFWDDDEVLVQYRPAKFDYRNFHEFCLHWWKPIGIDLPLPPSETVAPNPSGG